ncbi:MAG: ABC transporter permease [Elusimicrobiota bacterium]|jgi:phospholipid/cholesterol/gamma-HCH transport system permease protein
MRERLLSAAGETLIGWAESSGRASLLVRSSVLWVLRSRIEWRQALVQMMRIGVESFGVTVMTSLFTGMVLALQTGASFKSLFNEPLFTGTIVSFALVKELGPVMTALVVAGRAGAAIAAELGTMKVTEQVDALYTLGTDPVRYLVIPRVIAFLVVLPILTIFADYSGVIGGCIVANIKLGIPTSVYWHDVFDHLGNQQFFHGLAKTYVFAICISYISCYKGLNTSGGAEGVGKATTSAVVYSMSAVLVVDYFVTAILVAVGIT